MNHLKCLSISSLTEDGICHTNIPSTVFLEGAPQLSHPSYGVRSMNIVINGQFAEADEINTGFLQCSLLDSTLFLALYKGYAKEHSLSVNNCYYKIYEDDAIFYL